MQKLSKNANDIDCVSRIHSLRAYLYNYCGKIGWQRCLGGKRVITPLPAERGNHGLVLFLL
ncbi:MAG: hypothetical protein CM15mP62_11100 [Rhodospirillaceae bacterium]|nr:MAG: hypothetical protein CM15mP62_11100 [Rhodospirillaceae bacterium]